jgi:maltooligosyltrehalose trehalohydrolase
MERQGEVHRIVVEEARAGDRYFFVFPDGRKRPDPRSLSQPEGVHGPSEVVDPEAIRRIAAGSALPRRRWQQWVVCELHVVTFSPQGTFDGVIERLDYLGDELGISAIELLPIHPFPGSRNWGYDGAAPFAVHEAYGGPEGLARLVRAAHDRGIAMILDLVYNHLGPEGNYLREFGPYFTDRYETPWGEAVNFDGPGSEQVRAWAVENAAFWVQTYGVDGLRLDAVHAIHDRGPTHVVAEIGAAAQAAGAVVIAESDMNDPVTVLPRPTGWGLDAQWSDDLHHALHASLTGERTGYYLDFGRASDVALALERGFAYDGSRYSSFRQRWQGKSSAPMEAEQHVVCIQNHDQVGNRAQGERLSALAGNEAAKVGACVLLLSPGLPMLFMGEEYAAAQPFPFFTSHQDPRVVRGVRQGRRHEFAAFEWEGEVPDPQDPGTFEAARLHLDDRLQPPHSGVFRLYQRLLSLRSHHPALGGTGRKARSRATPLGKEGGISLERWDEGGTRRLWLLASLAAAPKPLRVEVPGGGWRLLLDSGDPDFAGPASKAPARLEGGKQQLEVPPHTAWLYERMG